MRYREECDFQLRNATEPFVGRGTPGPTGGAHSGSQTPKLDLGEGLRDRKRTHMKGGNGKEEKGREEDCIYHNTCTNKYVTNTI